MRTKVAILLALALSSCTGDDDEAIAKKALRPMLRDPDSIIVRNLSIGVKPATGRIICGEFNGRNGFGGMGEWQPFSVNSEVMKPVVAGGQDDRYAASALNSIRQYCPSMR